MQWRDGRRTGLPAGSDTGVLGLETDRLVL